MYSSVYTIHQFELKHTTSIDITLELEKFRKIFKEILLRILFSRENKLHSHYHTNKLNSHFISFIDLWATVFTSKIP